MMAKVKIVPVGNKGEFQWQIMCPGCGYIHALSPYVHRFNNNIENPTFSPSLLQDHNPEKVCHSFVVNGKMQFLGDCFHDLKNQTIELPEIE